jgi:hypothetical protein
MTYVALWARAFAITLAVEVPLATWVLGPEGRSRARRVGAALTGNLATHPAVWFILPEIGLRHTPFTALAEAWAILVEMCVYRLVFPTLPWARALGVAAIANGASFAIGIALR